MSLRRLAPRFVDWRLSRIDEEVDRVSCSSDATTPPSPPLPPPPPLLLDDDPADSETSAAQDELSGDETLAPPVPSIDQTAVIYSNADEWRKQQLERSAADDEREALRFIKEKYDSLGKIGVDKPTPGTPDQTAVVAGEQTAAAVYENVTRDVTAERRKVAVECAACRAEQIVSNSASQVVSCDSRQTGPVQRRRTQTQHESAPCQCQQHLDQMQLQQQETDRQRQRLGGECVPRSPLSDGELMQIELFYRSYKSSVYVCTCMATLSFSRPVITASAKSKSMPRSTEDFDDGVWACVRSGIPVIVRDNGDGRRRKRVCILLAERGTGFELWRAPLDRLSDYTVTAASVVAGGSPSAAVSCSQHTMRLSVDETMSVTARLAFDDQSAADEFHRQLVELATAGGSNGSATTVGGSQTKKKRHQKGVGCISKADISQPCCFSHVTRLERGTPCRGRPGLHIVVATGRQIPPAAGVAGVAVESTPPPSTTLRTARHCHSSFKGNHHV